MENNFQFARWKNTFAASAAAVASSWPCPEKQSLPSTSEKLFEYFSFLLSLCSAWFCLPLSASGRGERDEEKEGEDVLKLRSTTVIVDAWYAQLVVYYCQQQVCAGLLTPPIHNWPTARLLPIVVGVALLFLSRRQPSKHLQQCRKRIQHRHTQQTQYSTTEYNKTRVLWRQHGW